MSIFALPYFIELARGDHAQSASLFFCCEVCLKEVAVDYANIPGGSGSEFVYFILGCFNPLSIRGELCAFEIRYF